MLTFAEIEEKKKLLGEKIKEKLEKQGKDAGKETESIENFLSKLPSEHVDNLMKKLEELEGENVETNMQLDTTDLKSSQNATEINQIRDALRNGDMESATQLAESLKTTTK